MAHDLGARGVVRGLLILALLWWSWTGYAWLCNVVNADEGPIRIVLLVAMAAMFVLALTIPESFDDLPGGLNGPVVVAVCYFGFRLMHLVLFWVISSDDPGLRRQLIRFAPSMVGGTMLLLLAYSSTDRGRHGCRPPRFRPTTSARCSRGPKAGGYVRLATLPSATALS